MDMNAQKSRMVEQDIEFVYYVLGSTNTTSLTSVGIHVARNTHTKSMPECSFENKTIN
jgi:hypothetical protein